MLLDFAVATPAQIVSDSDYYKSSIPIIAAAVGAIIAACCAILQLVLNGRLQKRVAATLAKSQQDLETYKAELVKSQRELELKLLAKSQQDLETYKAELTKSQRELELSRQASYDFKIERLTPFFEAVNNAIVESYSAVVGLPMLAKFKNHIPAIIQQRNKDMKAWMDAAYSMSRLRISVLLSIDGAAIGPIIERIESFVQLQKKLIAARNEYFSDQIKIKDVASVHSDYVQTGFSLLIEIREAIRKAAGIAVSMNDENEDTTIQELPARLERSSIVSLAYGKSSQNAWVASWQVSAAILAYEKLDAEEFEKTVSEIAIALADHADVLDTKLARIGNADEQEYVLSANFADTASLQTFNETTLPAIKRQTKPLWKGLVTPVEMTIE